MVDWFSQRSPGRDIPNSHDHIVRSTDQSRVVAAKRHASDGRRARQRRNRRAIRMPMLIFGFSMTAVYLGLGSFLLLDKSFLPGVPSEFRNIFAALLLIYGAYRGWRIYADHT